MQKKTELLKIFTVKTMVFSSIFIINLNLLIIYFIITLP